MGRPADILTGREALCSLDLELRQATVQDFWKWAFSDLRANNLRGIFAEWLVAKLLNIDLSRRDFWAGWDLETTQGLRIEVKASAYLQTWTQSRPSKIIFSGLKGQTWNPETGYSGKASYNSDLYVFCVQIERQAHRWDALDLGQWRFYLLRREELVRRDCRSLSLPALCRISQELDATEFRRQALAIISGDKIWNGPQSRR